MAACTPACAGSTEVFGNTHSYSQDTSHANNDASVNFLSPRTVSDLNFSEVFGYKMH